MESLGGDDFLEDVWLDWPEVLVQITVVMVMLL